jgi:hypothetical protein
MRINIQEGDEMFVLCNAITGNDSGDDLGKDCHE